MRSLPGAKGSRGAVSAPSGAACLSPAERLREALRAFTLEDASAIPTADRAGLIGEVERVKALLWTLSTGTGSLPAPAIEQPDRLLSAQETARRLGRSVSWLYEHKRKLPFWKAVPGGGGGFSEQGLRRFLRRTG